MSKAAGLFYSTDSEKKTLHSTITPSEIQQELQQERWKSLAEYIIADLQDITGYPITSWIQGSYKYGTQIRPCMKGQESDIDLGLYFSWPGASTDGKYSAIELKALVQDSLKLYAEEADDVLEVIEPSKNRCARIRFKNGFHIDVPAYHYEPATTVCLLATEENEWEDSDPEKLHNWFLNRFSDEDASQVRRLIRYLKMWAALHFAESKKPSSTLLSVLVADAYSLLIKEEKEGDELAFRNIIEELLERLADDTKVTNPVNRLENLNCLSSEDCDGFQTKLEELLTLADKALETSTEFEAASIWTEVFNHFFPFSDPSITTGTEIVRVRFVPRVSVRAISRDNANYVVEDVNKIGPILKNCDIHFLLLNANELPGDARIEWVVRNNSDESDFENDLGHIATGINHTWREHSAYKGTHFMDVTVKSPIFGILGFVRIPVTISGTFMVPRNPPKPQWTRLRRRK